MTDDGGRFRGRRDAKRQQIRDGAKQLFLDQGFATASTDEIARAAAVSKRTLYAYYRTKEALLIDVLDTFVEELDADWARAMDRDLLDSRTALANALSALGCRVVSSLLRPDYLGLVRVIIAETPRVPELGELWSRTVVGRIRQVVRDLLERAAAAGIVQAGSGEAATRLFVGALVTYVVPDALLAAGPPPPPPPREIEQIADLLVRAVT